MGIVKSILNDLKEFVSPQKTCEPAQTKQTLTKKDRFQTIAQIMKELGYTGEITENTLIPQKMCEALTDEFVLRTGESITWPTIILPNNTVFAVFVRDLL